MAESTGTAKLINSIITTTSGDGKYPYLYVQGTTDAMTVDELHDQMISVHGEVSAGELTDDEKENPPTRAEFLAWHTLKQINYLKYLAEETDNWDGEHVIGTSPETLHVLLSEDGDKIYILEQLQKADISAMSYQDQYNVAQTDTWKNVTSVLLDMVPTGTGTVAEAKYALVEDEDQVSIAALQKLIDNADENFESEPFARQLVLLEKMIDSQAILSASTIKEKLEALKERLVRAISFYDAAYGPNVQQEGLTTADFGIPFNEVGTDEFVPGETKIDGYVIYRNDSGLYLIMDGSDYQTQNSGGIDKDTRDYFQDNLKDGDNIDYFVKDPKIPFKNMISLDDNAMIKQGYKTFIEQETIIATVQEQRWEIAQTGTLNGRRLDAPTLIAYMQMLSGLETEAIVAIGTEMIDQLNEFARMMAYCGDLITQWALEFDTSKPNQEKTYGGLTDNVGDLDLEVLKAIAILDPMFRGDAVHPVAAEFNITIPEIEFLKVEDTMEFETIDSVYLFYTLSRYEHLSEDDREKHGIEGLDKHDYITKFKYNIWAWVEYTKTKVDAFSTEISQSTQQIAKSTEMETTDVSTKTKEVTRKKDVTNSNLNLSQSVISRISFLG